MKRLLRISFDLALLSLIPVLSWFFLGILVDKRLISIFSLTYPLQFIYYIIKALFATGANISQQKDKNKDAVMSGILLGSLVAFLSFGLALVHVDGYISYMHMDIATYRTFTIYSIIQLFLSLEFAFILEKLYYQGQNVLANKYSLAFNSINFLALIGTSLLTKNQVIIVTATLIPLALFTIYVIFKNSDPFHLHLNLFKCFKYNASQICNNIFYFFIYLFGLSNVFSCGAEYASSIAFASLLTDVQWDTGGSIEIAATIDISKNRFNYKKHRKNAFQLMALLIGSSLLMFLCLQGLYDYNLVVVLALLGIDIINFLLYAVYTIKIQYLQLRYSAFVTAANNNVSSALRLAASFLATPFCTALGQILDSTYTAISMNYLFWRHFKVKKDGTVLPRHLNRHSSTLNH